MTHVLAYLGGIATCVAFYFAYGWRQDVQIEYRRARRGEWLT